MTHNLAPRNPLLNLLRRKESANDLPQPFARQILLLEYHVAGTGWRDLEDTEPHLQPGDEFNLLREPDNAHDSWAIQVLTREGTHLGYVPRATNETLARLMDAGKLVFAKLTKKNRQNDWLRLDIQIFMREL